MDVSLNIIKIYVKNKIKLSSCVRKINENCKKKKVDVSTFNIFMKHLHIVNMVQQPSVSYVCMTDRFISVLVHATKWHPGHACSTVPSLSQGRGHQRLCVCLYDWQVYLCFSTCRPVTSRPCMSLPSPPSHRDVVINAFVFVHQALHQANSRVVKRGGRTTAVTPRHYLDFINHFVCHTCWYLCAEYE